MPFTFTVVGEPAPKGSFRAYTYTRSAEKGGGIGARVTNNNKNTDGWQQAVAWSAAAELRRLGLQMMFTCALDIAIEFALRRTKAWPKKCGKVAHGVTPAHLVKPDTDKLLRACLDALKGVLYADDSQVVRLTGAKRYAAAEESPSAVITITPIVAAAAPLFERK